MYLTELLWCPVSLQCSPAPELALPNHIYYSLVLQHLLLYMETPWQSKEQVGALFFAGEECHLCCGGSRKELELNLMVVLILDTEAGQAQLPQGNAPLRPVGSLWLACSRSPPCSCFMDPFETGQHCRMELVQLFSLPAVLAPVLGV